MKRTRITKKEWQSVVDYAFKIVDASYRKNRQAGKEYTAKLHSHLKKLERKYGHLAGIVETQADFTWNTRQRLSLFKRAYSLAEKQGNSYTLVSVSKSIAEHYIEDLRDKKSGALWLTKFRSALKKYSDDSFTWHYRRLANMLKKTAR